MTHSKNKIKVFGKRVLVEKERVDVGGMKLSPTFEEDGQKNLGKIVGVGQIGFLNKLRGVRVGKIIYFKKHFVCNADQDNALVFVDIDSITGIQLDPPLLKVEVSKKNKHIEDVIEKAHEIAEKIRVEEEIETREFIKKVQNDPRNNKPM